MKYNKNIENRLQELTNDEVITKYGYKIENGIISK